MDWLNENKFHHKRCTTFLVASTEMKLGSSVFKETSWQLQKTLNNFLCKQLVFNFVSLFFFESLLKWSVSSYFWLDYKFVKSRKFSKFFPMVFFDLYINFTLVFYETRYLKVKIFFVRRNLKKLSWILFWNLLILKIFFWIFSTLCTIAKSSWFQRHSYKCDKIAVVAVDDAALLISSESKIS